MTDSDNAEMQASPNRHIGEIITAYAYLLMVTIP